MPCWTPCIAANSDGDAMTQMRLEDVSAALEVSQRPSRHDALPQLVAARKQFAIHRSSSPAFEVVANCRFITAVTDW